MTNELVSRFGIKFDLLKALNALQEVTNRHPLNENFRQINFVHLEPECRSVYHGTGTLYDKLNQRWTHREGDFRYFANEFKLSYFYEIFQRVETALSSQSIAGHPRRIGRMRLMLMPPKTCYSMHEDPTVRFHLPLITNSQALIVFRSGHIFHLPANGDLYLVNTRNSHTAMNGGESARIHLVLSEAEKIETEK